MRSFRLIAHFAKYLACLFLLGGVLSSKLWAFPNPPITYLGIEKGLSNNSVRRIYQDHQGFMWFGTYDGLNRYDGYEFQVFRNKLNDSTSLPHNYIYTIHEDGEQNLWVGTGQGIGIYNSLSGKFLPAYYTPYGSKGRAKITSNVNVVRSDAKGNIFIGTNGAGLMVRFKGQQTAIQVPFKVNGKAVLDANVRAIYVDKNQRIWLLIRDIGLCIYDVASREIRVVIWTLEMEDPSVVTGGITNSPQQRRVWVAAYYQITGMKITDSLGGRGLARLRLNDWVVYGLYENNDMRNSPYNFRRSYTYNDPSKPATYGNPVPYTGFDTVYRLAPHITKWYQFDPKDEFGFAMIKDIILMRLGETYLYLAEAQFKQGKLAEAAATLNLLRARANATPITAAQVTLDFILDERARELIGEEKRRMTLMRTGNLVDRSKRLNATSPLNQLSGISNTNLLMPIPLSEINLNKDAVLEQNPGY